MATGDRRQATTARTVCLQYTSAGSACSDMLSACCMALHGDALSAAALLDGCWGRDVIRRAAGMGLSFPSTHRARTSINSSQFARPVRLASKRAANVRCCSTKDEACRAGPSSPGFPHHHERAAHARHRVNPRSCEQVPLYPQLIILPLWAPRLSRPKVRPSAVLRDERACQRLQPQRPISFATLADRPTCEILRWFTTDSRATPRQR